MQTDVWVVVKKGQKDLSTAIGMSFPGNPRFFFLAEAQAENFMRSNKELQAAFEVVKITVALPA
jgi:hypothetical protein